MNTALPTDDSEIEYFHRQYVETRNAVYAALAFELAVERGVCPPQDVLDWMAGGLRSWLMGQGETRLDQALGLRFSGRGKDPAFKRIDMERRDAGLLLQMDVLIHLGASREIAAALVCNPLRRRSERPMLSEQTLINKHGKRKTRPIGRELEERVSNPEFVKEYLALFDSRYMNDKLKSIS